MHRTAGPASEPRKGSTALRRLAAAAIACLVATCAWGQEAATVLCDRGTAKVTVGFTDPPLETTMTWYRAPGRLLVSIGAGERWSGYDPLLYGLQQEVALAGGAAVVEHLRTGRWETVDLSRPQSLQPIESEGSAALVGLLAARLPHISRSQELLARTKLSSPALADRTKKLSLQQPVSFSLGHAGSSLVATYESGDVWPRRVAVLDEEGGETMVQTVTQWDDSYGDADAPVAVRRPVVLECQRSPGSVAARAAMSVGDGVKGERQVWEADLPQPARRVVTRLRWLSPERAVTEEGTLYDGAGKALVHYVLVSYDADVAVPVAMFR